MEEQTENNIDVLTQSEAEVKAQVKALREQGTISVQGGQLYLKAANRIAMFRLENPLGSIQCTFESFGEATLATCQVRNGVGMILAQLHKEVKVGRGKGAAKDNPWECAQTGSISRALGACGYGTLSGDFDADEDDHNLADAPQAPKKKKAW